MRPLIAKSMVLGLLWASVGLYAQPPGLDPAWAPAASNSGWGVSNLLGSAVQFSSVADQSGGDTRSYSIPIILPLEIQLGRFYMGGAFEYAVQEYRSAEGSSSVQGPRLAGLLLGYELYNRGAWRLSWQNASYTSVTRDRGALEGPEYAWFANERYRIDNEVYLRYRLERADLRFGLGHQWRTERDGYDRGETALASLAFGFGFGNFSPAIQEFETTVLLGVNARYNYADENDGARVAGTEYGTVFVAPGLQIATQALSLQAMVEVPVQHVRPESESSQEELRANFGLRYYLR